MGVNPNQLSQDKDFLGMSPQDQMGYLSSQDPDFAKMAPADQAGYISHLTGKPAVQSSAPKANTTPLPPQPSAWQVLTQPTEKTDKEYLGYTGLPGVVGATEHGLNEVARGTTGALKGAWDAVTNPPRGAVEQTVNALGPGALPIYRGVKPLVDAARQVPQIPAAVRDINASPDPLGHYANAAEDTASQGAGQALVSLAGESAPEVVGAAADIAKRGSSVIKGAAKASGIGLSPIEKLVKAAGPSVRDANFPQTLETASPELARQNAITPVHSVGDMAEAAHTAADNLWKQQIEPQISRNATEVINERLPESAPEGFPKAEAQGSIGDKIRGSVDPGMKRMFPEQAAKVMDFAQKLDEPMTLGEANENLRALNAELKSYYKMTPEGRAAAGITNGLTSAMEEGASGLRQQMYDKLDSLGETDPAGLRKQYGALKQVQDVFRKRAVVSGRQAPLNLQQLLALAGGAGEAAGVIFTGHPGAVLAGAVPITAATLLKYFNSPDMLVRRGLSGLPDAATEPFNLRAPAGRMPLPLQQIINLSGGENIPGEDLQLTPPGEMPPEVQRPFSFMDNPNTNQSGPVAPGGTGTGPRVPQPNAFDVSGLRSKLAPQWDPSKAFDVSELRSKLLKASAAPENSVPRSLGAAAAAPAVEEMPRSLREVLGLERRATPRSAPMNALELEAAIKGRKPITTPFYDTDGAMNTIANDPNMPRHPSEMTQGGHAGNGVASVEELSRPGTNYVVSPQGKLTFHGRAFAPEETPRGAAHVTVLPNGTVRVNAGTLTPTMKKALQNGAKIPKTISMADVQQDERVA